jgi:hypothetical protein
MAAGLYAAGVAVFGGAFCRCGNCAATACTGGATPSDGSGETASET